MRHSSDIDLGLLCQHSAKVHVHEHYSNYESLDVLWGQPIKLIQVVSTSEFDAKVAEKFLNGIY